MRFKSILLSLFLLFSQVAKAQGNQGFITFLNYSFPKVKFTMGVTDVGLDIEKVIPLLGTSAFVMIEENISHRTFVRLEPGFTVVGVKIKGTAGSSWVPETYKVEYVYLFRYIEFPLFVGFKFISAGNFNAYGIWGLSLRFGARDDRVFNIGCGLNYKRFIFELRYSQGFYMKGFRSRELKLGFGFIVNK